MPRAAALRCAARHAAPRALPTLQSSIFLGNTVTPPPELGIDAEGIAALRRDGVIV